MLDAEGKPVTRWDGRTTKPSPVTGEEIPDETARVTERRYLNARKAEWPKADYIVGNPPFIGNKRMRFHLGDGYVEAVRTAYRELPETIDFVMYWWSIAAERLKTDQAKRFGFITTNSITQVFNRTVLDQVLDHKRSLFFAISDHPWVDESGSAAVRIGMTVCAANPSDRSGTIGVVCNESREIDSSGVRRFDVVTRRVSVINSDLSYGVDTAESTKLKANSGLASQGVTPLGEGFRVSPDFVEGLSDKTCIQARVLRPYMIGRDVMQSHEVKFIIDFYGLAEAEARQRHPVLYQRVYDRVRPERQEKKRDAYRDSWWVFAEPRATLRPAIDSLRRYLVTCRTAKHRVFTFLDSAVLPDAKLVAIGLDDAYFLGVMSSWPHLTWALKTGAFLEDRPNYNHSDCFVKFPFPDPDEATKQRIRELGEQLDAHRKRQQELHPALTMTGMYNVLEKLRSGETLSTKEQTIHEQGLVSVLKQIHDDLDATVAAAYGWPADLDDEAILQRLVDLNRERAEEERRGLVRWLRPEFQNPKAAGDPAKTQQDLVGAGSADEETDDEEKAPVVAPAKKIPWPTEKDRQPHQERVRLLRQALTEAARPLSAGEVAGRFSKANKKKVHELLETLVAVGQARVTPDERYAL